MTIWLFGDSYAQVFVKNNDSKQWAECVSDYLNDSVNENALQGSSLSYTYHQFHLNRKYIKENDVLIIVLTSIQRRWFFFNRPESAVSLFKTKCSKEEYEANKYYRLYLDNNPDVNNTYLMNFLYNVDAFANTLKLRTIIINQSSESEIIINKIKNNLKHVYVTKGTLSEVSRKEMNKDFFEKWISSSTSDPRINHLCRSNHIILGNKIIDYITTNKEIDLNEGFVENIIDFNANKDIYDYELFENSYKEFNLS